MLQPPRCRRNATQPTPYREGRLLWFAGGTNPPADPNLPPEPEQNKGEGADVEQAEKAENNKNNHVEDEQEKTREEAKKAVEGTAAEEQEETESTEKVEIIPPAAELRNRIQTIDAQIVEIRSLVSQRAIQKEIESLPDEDQALFWAHLRRYDDWREESGRWTYLTGKLAEWDNMSLHPREFRNLMAEYYKGQPEEGAVMQAIDAKLTEHGETIKNWDKPSIGDKRKVIKDLNAVANTEEILRAIDARSKAWADETAMIHKSLKESAENQKTKPGDWQAPIDKKTGKPLKFNGVFESLGISFHSPLEVWEAMKMISTSYKNAFDEKLRQKATILAKQWGSTLRVVDPFYGKEVAADIDKQADSLDNKAKNEYKETLADSTFMDLFSPGGALDDVENDRPKCLAILEYAASKGWLYDLSDNANPNNVRIFKRYRNLRLQNLVPEHWSPQRVQNYFISLQGQNSSGESSEQDAGKKKAGRHEKFDPLMHDLEEELKKHNYFGAIGIMEKALDKGKEGYTSARMATLVLRELRQNPDMRRLISSEVINKMGNWVFGKIAFTGAHFSIDRDPLDNWNKANQPENLENSGVLGRNVGRMENIIRNRIGSAAFDRIDKRKIDDITGKILGTRMVNLNDELAQYGVVTANPYMSIFQSEFTDYRKNLAMFQYYTNTSAGKEAADYFTNDSEIPLLPQSYYESILNIRSPGEFTDPASAELFIGQIVNRFDDLEKHLPEAAELFRTEVGAKLNAAFDKIWPVSHNALYSRSYRRGDVYQELIISGLSRRRLLDVPEKIQKAIEEQQKTQGGGASARNQLKKVLKSDASSDSGPSSPSEEKNPSRSNHPRGPGGGRRGGTHGGHGGGNPGGHR